MSARSVSKGLLDARFKRVRALLALGQGGGGLLPLSRTAFIDGGRTGGQDGSIAEPFQTIQGWLNTISPTGSSVADNSAMELGLIAPCLNGYTENPVLPAYRNVELRAVYNALPGAPFELTGGLTWHNSVAGGGAHAPALATLSLHNLSVSGGFVVTDDVVNSQIFLSGDSTGAAMGGLLDLSAATKVLQVVAQDYSLLGGLTSVTGVAGAQVAVVDAQISGAVTCKAFISDGASVSSMAIDIGAAAQAATFVGTSFTAATTITGLGGSGVLFDGPSWLSLLESGGTVATSFVLVVGGFFGAPVEGAALADNVAHALTLSLNGTGATAGYTRGGNHYTLPVGNVIGADLVLTLGVGGALPGDGIRITRNEIASGHALVVKDDAATVLATIPANNRGFVDALFNGVHFVCAGCGAGVTA